MKSWGLGAVLVNEILSTMLMNEGSWEGERPALAEP
jgi:hypothetical protein